MEKKTIAYTKGITRSPSDMLCQDGELAECINLEVRNEELVPIEMPTELPFSLDNSEKLLLVHNLTSGEKNYITSTDNTLKAFYIAEESKVYYDFSKSLGDIKSIQAIGNTIVVYTEDAPHYFLFKDSNYKYLGSKMPELSISFGLTGNIEQSEDFFVQVDDFPPNNVISNMTGLPDEYIDSITDQIMGEVNKFINEKSVTTGKFMYPFFVRYAYLLYDGSYTMHSAPVLMLPSTTMSPLCLYVPKDEDEEDLKNHGWRYNSRIAAYLAELEMYPVNPSDLSGWTDIIKEVVLFVSPPIYTFDQNGKVKQATASLDNRQFKTSFLGRSYAASAITRGMYNMKAVAESELLTGGIGYVWDLPAKELTDIYTSVSDCAQFYKYVGFKVEDLANINTIISNEELNVNPISAIETKETLSDDYMTHDTLVPASTFVYNKRLIIANIKRGLFNGFSAESIASGSIESYDDVDIYTYIHSQSGDDIIVKAEPKQFLKMYGIYLFYPDTDAYKMVVVNNTQGTYAEVTLSEHKLLNGAFAFSSFEPLTFQPGTPGISVTGNIEKLPNKIFTSEVNNPFYFPLEGINTVGSDEIIGMAAVTVPISQGQFGQYPLLAFCSDGNFALKVDTDGYYAGISPVQEDTVLGSDKITPLENSVAIITKKGLMMTSGGEMAQIAVNMDGAHFSASSLTDVGAGIEAFTSLVEQTDDTQGFLSYLYGARMAYDYSSNRLVIYNTEKTYSYVYSFDNGIVTKLSLNGESIATSVLDYPDTILQTESGKLYSLYDKKDVNTIEDRHFGIAVTRPLKLDNASAYKIIHHIKNMGRFSGESYVKYRLYGSMDGQSYRIVTSLRGRSYLFYRIVFYINMLPKESFSGSLMAYDYRMSHKFR